MVQCSAQKLRLWCIFRNNTRRGFWDVGPGRVETAAAGGAIRGARGGRQRVMVGTTAHHGRAELTFFNRGALRSTQLGARALTTDGLPFAGMHVAGAVETVLR